MAKLKLADYMRLFLQAMAAFVGLAGLSIGGYMPITGMINTVRQIANGELVSWGILFAFVGFGAVFLIGAYLVFVSYLTLFKFSTNAIGHLCAVLTLVLLGFLFHYIKPLLKYPSDTSFLGALYGLIITLAPLCLAVFFYRISKNICIKLTGVPLSNDNE